MRILLDQGLPRGTVRALLSAGHAAEHVADIGLANADDAAILVVARGKGAIVVTLHADFHRLLAIDRQTSPSVVRIRIEGLKAMHSEGC
jgi:predicted nuclease of predicted toxin-antitoxin system